MSKDLTLQDKAQEALKTYRAFTSDQTMLSANYMARMNAAFAKDLLRLIKQETKK